MRTTDVAVTGLGLITPCGLGVEAGWAAVTTGKPTAALDPELAGSPVRISCRVPDFDPEHLLGARRALRLDRFTQFGLVAAREAIEDAGLDPASWDGARVAVVLGCADGGPGTVEAQHAVLKDRGPGQVSPLLVPMQLPNMLAGQVAIEYHARGPSLVTATACASGTTAIGLARDLLLLDRCDIVLTGGAEAMVTPLVMAGFAQMRALSTRHEDPEGASRPFDADRDGFVAGEGAGVLVLERTEDARARKARVRARVVGYGTSTDARHITSPHPDGSVAEVAVRTALRDAGAAPRDVAHVNAHGTATPQNDLAESAMLERVLPHAPHVASTKGVTGHLLGASGAVEAVFTVLSVERQLVPPTANLHTLDPRIPLDVRPTAVPGPIGLALSNSFAFGGHNAVLAIAPS
jgi:3-oxoacyl-[acyl-carrier-protein] synthase II